MSSKLTELLALQAEAKRKIEENNKAMAECKLALQDDTFHEARTTWRQEAEVPASSEEDEAEPSTDRKFLFIFGYNLLVINIDRNVIGSGRLPVCINGALAMRGLSNW